ncbi:hypothetical protein TIFTF001_015432 [Ficus carica]|uniref:Uncharacterized protein n=1 Tax=Ficus carica TaxID=3494 RepID=A0AA88A4H0_FICCA|nr:hypothetical protein TIFTF001_015432 [Ficus carica]
MKVPSIHSLCRHDGTRAEPNLWQGTASRPTTDQDRPYPSESEQVITPTSAANRTGQLRQQTGTSDRTNAEEPEHIVHTIFGGTATGDMTSSRRSYARSARQVAHEEYINITEHIAKNSHQDSVPDDEANKLLHPHYDALVREIKITDNIVRCVLIDNGCSTDILLMDAFTRLKIDGAVLTPIQTLLYGFVGEFVRAIGIICLSITIDDEPEKATRMVEFLVVDKPTVDNAMLERPTPNVLNAVVSTYHLAVKFPTPNGVGIFR